MLFIAQTGEFEKEEEKRKKMANDYIDIYNKNIYNVQIATKDILKRSGEKVPLILFCGDPHGEFQHIVRMIRRNDYDAVIILGDLELRRKNLPEITEIIEKTQFFYIHGNHDTDNNEFHDTLMTGELAKHNISGRVVDVKGVKIAGIGGVFRGQIWHPSSGLNYSSRTDYLAKCGKGSLWRGGMPLKHRSTIFPDDFQALCNQKADVLVTHEAPLPHEKGFNVFNELGEQMNVMHYIHGHHHESYPYEDNRKACVPIRECYALSINVDN